MTRWARSKSVLKHERQPGEATTWSEFVAQRQQAAKHGRGDATKPQGNVKVGQANAARKRDGLLVVKKEPTGQNGTHPRGAHAPGGTTGACQAKGKISTEEDLDWLKSMLDTKGAAEKGPAATPKWKEFAFPTKPFKTPRPSLTEADGASVKSSTLSQNNAKKGLSTRTKQTQDPKGNKVGFPAKLVTPAVADVALALGGSEAVTSHTGVQPPFKKGRSKIRGPAANSKTAQATKKQDVPLSDETSETKVGGERPALGGTKTTKKKAAPKRPAQVACKEEPSEEGKDDGEEETPARKRPRTGPGGGGGSKAERLQRLRQEREAKGLLLLPEKVERHIYLVKKAMRKKGLPGEEIKQVVRKMRRKEELKFRKQLAKLCFKCRQPGHKVSDCPQVLQDSDEAVGICFKCGSTEHFSSACNVQTSKDNEFPYAKCFICKEQGHISRKCPRNDKGVYPKGGHCSFCGGIDHFKRECPEMEKNKKKNTGEGEEFAGDLASIDRSADAENVPALQPLLQGKKAKVVSF